MLTISRYNHPIPTVHRSAFAAWPFTDEMFRPFAEMVASPMRIRVKETDEAYLFEAELPGYESSEINLSVQDSVLTITAEHKESEESAENFAARSIRRSFTLDGIDEESISAQYKNGVLRVTLPKEKAPEAPTPRRIEVQ